MASQIKLNKLIKELKGISLPLSGIEAIQTLEKLKRLNLYLPLFVCLEFPPNEDKEANAEAWDFSNLIMHHAKKRNVSSHIIIAEALENEIKQRKSQPTKGVKLPDFIKKHLDTLIIYLEFLINGNEELEKQIPPGAMSGATKIATSVIGIELEKNLSHQYQSKFE